MHEHHLEGLFTQPAHRSLLQHGGVKGKHCRANSSQVTRCGLVNILTTIEKLILLNVSPQIPTREVPALSTLSNIYLGVI